MAFDAFRAPGILLFVGLAAAASASDNPLARHRAVSAPDCVDVSSMTVQYDPAPSNRTYLRVQHMGDPGTTELLQQVANPVGWDVGATTGLALPADSQRGYIDLAGNSAFQLRCNDAGFFINTARFNHTAALVGEGPNVSVARDFDPPLAAFADGASLVVEADVRVPRARTAVPPVGEGTAQVGFFIYLRDRTTRTVITQLIGVFDNRPAGVNGSGVEGLGHDGVNAFVSSPLAATDGLGRPVRFVMAPASSASMQHVEPWAETRHFAGVVRPAHFAAALARLGESGLRLSPQPSDYDVLSFGVGGEVIPGTGRDHEVELGASVSSLALRIEPLPRLARP